MCATPVAPGDRFCVSCGTPVIFCHACGELLLAADRFCPKCGAGTSGATVGTPSGGAPSPWLLVRERLAAATAGEFELRRELGRGGMAAVYLAQELALNRQVAIKVMAPGVMMGEGMVERFRQEAVTVANLNHPNIITIHAVRQFEDLHFFVMQYVDGKALDEILASRGPLPVDVVRALVAQVGSGLAYAHRRGVIHRDIKPANVLLDIDGNAIVMDFGIAKVAEVPGQTKTGTMVGTPAYMSPEQCAGEPLTWSSDLYSLGVVAHELLTGTPPFTGSNFTIMKGHLETPPPPLRVARPECPEALEQCVLRMLGKTPEDRFPSMAAALQALGPVNLHEGGPLRTALQELAGGSRTQPAPRVAAAPPPRTRATPPATAAPPTRRSNPVVVRNMVLVSGVPDRVETGDEFHLTATVRSSAGEVLGEESIAWESSDVAVLTVDASGNVLATGPGTAEVIARAGSAKGSVEMRVRKPSAISLELPQARRSVITGEQVTLTAVLKDRRGRAVTEPVSWATSDPAIATISEGGVLVARAPGAVRVTATAAGMESVLEMSVAAPAPPPPPPVTIAPAVAPSAPVKPAVAPPAAPAPVGRPSRRAVRWPLVGAGLAAVAIVAVLLFRASGNEANTPAAATPVPADSAVQAPGVTPAATGPVETPAVPAPSGPGANPAAATPGIVHAVTVDAPARLAEQDTVRLQASATDIGGKAVTIQRLRWTSSAPAIASVGGTTGVLIGRKAGRATVTATADGVSRRVIVEVTPRPAVAAAIPTPPPAAPPPASEPAAVAERAVRAAAVACIAALQRLNADRMSELYLPLTDDDRDNLSHLTALMRHTEWGLAVEIGAVTLTPRVAGDHVYGDFPAQFNWKTSFGGKRQVDVIFRVDAKNAGGSWQAAGCRLQGSPKL